QAVQAEALNADRSCVRVQSGFPRLPARSEKPQVCQGEGQECRGQRTVSPEGGECEEHRQPLSRSLERGGIGRIWPVPMLRAPPGACLGIPSRLPKRAGMTSKGCAQDGKTASGSLNFSDVKACVGHFPPGLS